MADRDVRRALTPLGFRRDVRLFLALLVGFLSLLLVTVLLVAYKYEGDAESATRVQWERAADSAAGELGRAATDRETLETLLQVISGRYGVVQATLARPSGPPIRTGMPVTSLTETYQRLTSAGVLTLVFDASHLSQMRTTFVLTAAITLGAAGAGVVLLLFFLPTITGPIQAMLDSASEFRKPDASVDEREYLIETFRQSIATLRSQEAELQRLHEREKSRADDLERVTAALTRSINTGFVALDPGGRVIEMNAAAREILQPAPDPSGDSPAALFGDNAFSDSLARAVRERRAMTRVEVALDGDLAGTARTIGLTTVPLIGEEQQFLGVLALFTDLTPLRLLENRVRELQSLADLGEISAGIAHEFRNSLATILGYLRLARRAAADDDAPGAASANASAEREAQLLSKAVDALLAFARPMSIDLQPCDLLEIAEETRTRLAAESEGLSITSAGEPARVYGDPALLGRAVENLVRNAIESVRQHGSGEVRIRVHAADEAELVVEDTGAGLDPAEVPRLLLPFQTNRPGGYGIGLPLARKIVLLHGGTLHLSGLPGNGAVATVRLPWNRPAPTVTKSADFASSAQNASLPRSP